jgi:hypothetical protein
LFAHCFSEYAWLAAGSNRAVNLGSGIRRVPHGVKIRMVGGKLIAPKGYRF